MRIGIDYTSAFHQRAGIGRLTRELVRELARLDTGHEFRLLVRGARKSQLPPPPGPSFGWHSTRISQQWFARIWQRANLPVPRATWWTGPLDVFHAPDFVLPPLPRTLPGILTVPDLSFIRSPDTTMPGMHGYLGKGVPRSVRRATHIIAISESTRNDLIELYGTHPDKITVIYPGVQPHFKPVEDAQRLAAVRHKYDIGTEPFILTVGTLEPRKNHIGLLRAYARLDTDHKLVIAGGSGWAYDDVPAEVHRLGLQSRVLFPGFVADDDLPALYSAADLFVFPSFYEGFGLPLLEAMACSTPVVAANTSSLPEVVGEGGLLVDPHNTDQLASAMLRMLTDHNLRQASLLAARKQAATFTWQQAAADLLALYERVATVR